MRDERCRDSLLRGPRLRGMGRRHQRPQGARRSGTSDAEHLAGTGN